MQTGKRSGYKGTNSHVLTAEDRSKGGKTLTEKKRRALTLNAITTGKNVKKISGDMLYCNGCSLRGSCSGYSFDQSCSIVSTETFKQFGRLVSGTPQDYLKKIMQVLTDYEVSGKLDGNPTHGRDLAMLLLKVMEAKERFAPLSVGEQPVMVTYSKPPWIGKQLCSNCKGPVKATPKQEPRRHSVAAETKPVKEPENLSGGVAETETPKRSMADLEEKPKPRIYFNPSLRPNPW